MGDQVLVLFARLFLELVPEHSVCARLGGEEFLMLVPNTTEEDILLLAEAMHGNLADAMSSLPPDCSVSIGIGFSSGTDQSLDALVSRADQALYGAKTSGRNCTRVWTTQLANTETHNTRTRNL